MRTDPVARSSIPVAAAAGLLHRHRPDAHRVAREPPRTYTRTVWRPREEIVVVVVVVVVHHGGLGSASRNETAKRASQPGTRTQRRSTDPIESAAKNQLAAAACAQQKGQVVSHGYYLSSSSAWSE
jgi:hypothetical protein